MFIPEKGGSSAIVVAVAAGIAIIFFVIHTIVSYRGSPLRSIPGPFWAKFTDLWRLLDFCRATQIQTQQELHRKLGTAVRLGPNMVSLSDPSLLKQIYGTRGEFVKV